MPVRIETGYYSSTVQNKKIKRIGLFNTNLAMICYGNENGGIFKIIHKKDDGSYYGEIINVYHGDKTIETTVPYKNKNNEEREIKIRISAP